MPGGRPGGGQPGGGRPGGGMGGPMGGPSPRGSMPPPPRGWGYPRRYRRGGCFPGCCMYLLGAGGVIGLIVLGISMLI